MSHPILERHLKHRTWKPVYLFYGEEQLLLRRGLERLQEGLWPEDESRPQKTVFDAGEVSLAEVLGQARVPSLWSSGQLLILWQVERYKAPDLAPLGPYLEAPAPHTCLVLIAPGLKPKDLNRHHYWQRLQEHEAALGFFPPREAALPRWLEQEARRLGKILAPAVAPRLIEMIGGNLLELTQELEKLALYAGSEKTITLAMVNHLSQYSRSHSIFELVDALGQQRPSQALQVLGRLLALGEPPLKILVMLARQLRLLIRLKEYQSRGRAIDELSSHLGLPGLVVQKLQRQATRFPLEQLKQHLENLHQADLGLKTSTIPPQLWLENVILALCPPTPVRKQQSGH